MHADPQTDASFRGTVNPRIFGPGYGYLRSGAEPVAVIYAADQLRLLLTMAPQVARIDSREAPSVDLSNIELYGVSWKGIDFRWLTVAWMPDIDLRSSNLADSAWGPGTTLRHAYLQCADLSGADFRGVNLTNADLRGADVSGANFAVRSSPELRPPGRSVKPRACTSRMQHRSGSSHPVRRTLRTGIEVPGSLRPWAVPHPWSGTRPGR